MNEKASHVESDTGTFTLPDGDTQKRSGLVALIGAPNVGKSTLLNHLSGNKISVVTHKAQTTRAAIRGIVIEGNSQIIFIDTPGIFTPRRQLDRRMVHTAWNGASDADLVAFMVDAKRGIDTDTASVLDRISTRKCKAVLIINKIDLVKKERLFSLITDLNARADFEHTFMICAESGDGLPGLRRYFSSAVPPGPWLYPEDQISDISMRLLAAEITREKLFLRVHDELPYALTVETTSWKDLRRGGLRIEQTIYVERESQRKIILGKGGHVIKTIGMASRHELEALLETSVHLFLFVKVRENWSDDPERYREMGLHDID